MEQLPLNFLTCIICQGHPILEYNSTTGVFTVSTCTCSAEWINSDAQKSNNVDYQEWLEEFEDDGLHSEEEVDVDDDVEYEEFLHRMRHFPSQLKDGGEE